MKINKNIIKELNDYLEEFDLTEIEYTEKDVKVKVSKSRVSKNFEKGDTYVHGEWELRQRSL